jgi:hypothetical protein
MTPNQLEQFFFSLPLLVGSFGSLKQITECTLESLYSIFPRPRSFSASLTHVSSELFEIGVKLIEPGLNPSVKSV